MFQLLNSIKMLKHPKPQKYIALGHLLKESWRSEGWAFIPTPTLVQAQNFHLNRNQTRIQTNRSVPLLLLMKHRTNWMELSGKLDLELKFYERKNISSSLELNSHRNVSFFVGRIYQRMFFCGISTSVGMCGFRMEASWSVFLSFFF